MMLLESLKNAISGKGRSATVAKNVLASFAIKGASIFVSFALVPLTIGYVSSELYGVWLTLSSILTWLNFLDVGFSQGLKNKLTEAIALEDWEKGRYLVSTTYGMMIAIFVPICIVLEIIIPFVDWTSLLNVSPQYEGDITKVMLVLVAFACLQMIIHVLVSVIAAFQKVALSNSFPVIGNVISLLVIYVLTKTCPSSLLLLAITFGSMPILVTFVASFIMYSGQFKAVAPRISYFDKSYIKEIFGLGYKFFIINIQVIVLYQSTNILISNVSSPNEVTTYNIAYKLLSIAMMAYTIITAPLWPAYTDAFARGDYDWMKNMKNKMHRILIISILGCAIVAFASPWIYQLWIGDTPHIPYMMTLLVAIYVSVYCWMSLNGTLIVGMGKVNVETCIVLIGMVVHIPLSFFLSSFMGAYGVLTSLIVINFTYALVMQVQVNKLLNKTAKGIWNK